MAAEAHSCGCDLPASDSANYVFQFDKDEDEYHEDEDVFLVSQSLIVLQSTNPRRGLEDDLVCPLQIFSV